MKLKEIKFVKLFKFLGDKSQQVNIYVEPISDNTGRLIISTPYKIFQRYFDGAGGGIYNFLMRQTSEGIVGCFENATEEDQELLAKRLEEVWPIFIKQIKGLNI